MKAFAFVLLCALAAVQGRYTALQSTRSAAALGENPWLVHLRIAVSTSGLLNTGAGSLISNSWILTTADNVATARFIWARYGVVNVVNPTAVTENSVARTHPNYDAATKAYNIALISILRDVLLRPNIAPISPAGAVIASATFCNFGGKDGPGEVLNCYNVGVAQNEDGSLAVSSSEVQASAYDKGAPLVSNGTQVGLLVGAGSGSEDSVGEFIATATYVDWIERETGLVLNVEAVSDDAPETVHFV